MEYLPVERMGLAPDALSGQVAVVTGGGEGVGHAVAVALARLGGSVVVAGISPAGQETGRIIREGGGKVLLVEADVSSEADVARLARRTREVFGVADVLINTAATCPAASVLDLDAAAWDRVIAANLRGTFLTCKAFLPGMLGRGRGTIVNVISTDAGPLPSACDVSRHGIAAFSHALADEVGPQGVRVIALAPGVAEPSGTRTAGQDLASRSGMPQDESPSGAGPADHAAAAIACLVTVLASEYHGELVDAPTVLARAGFTAGPGPQVETVAPAAELAPEAATGWAGALQQAVALSEQLQETITETGTEFVQLPDFVRPLARDGFESKAGQRIEDWSRTAEALTERLKKMATADRAAEAALRADYPRLRPMFDGLMRYYREAPTETACFTTHLDPVASVNQVMRERESVVRALLETLETIVRVTP